MLGNSLKTVVDKTHFTVNFYSFSLHPSTPGKTFLSEPFLGKLEKFSNEGMKEEELLEAILFFLTKKAI